MTTASETQANESPPSLIPADRSEAHADLKPSGQELAEPDIVVYQTLSEAWKNWHQAVKNLSGTIGGITLSQSTLFSSMADRLPREPHPDVTQISEQEARRYVERLNVLVAEVQTFESDYADMQRARQASEKQRLRWSQWAKQYWFGLSEEQKKTIQQAQLRIDAFTRSEDFRSAALEYTNLEGLYQINEGHIVPMSAAREKALKAKQRWLALAEQIKGHNIDTISAVSAFESAQKQAMNGQLVSSSEVYSKAERRWIAFFKKGLVVKATPVLVKLSGGQFMMGDESNLGQRDERPVLARLVEAFAMSSTEVTFDQYDAYTEATGLELIPDEGWGRGARPVVNVSFSDVQRFISWLSASTNRNFALPSETQWEYAARSGLGANKAEGSHLTGKAHCEGCNGWGHSQTMAVAQFGANESGLFDLFGNVWEWVADCYRPTYEEAATENCDIRVARGGSWADLPSELRPSNRTPVEATQKSNRLGFRLVENF